MTAWDAKRQRAVAFLETPRTTVKGTTVDDESPRLTIEELLYVLDRSRTFEELATNWRTFGLERQMADRAHESAKGPATARGYSRSVAAVVR